MNIKRLRVQAAHDVDVTIQILRDGRPMSIHNLEVELFVKPLASTPNDDSSVSKLTIGHGITVLDEARGEILAAISHTVVGDSAANKWWRTDVVDPNNSDWRVAAVGGPFEVDAA